MRKGLSVVLNYHHQYIVQRIVFMYGIAALVASDLLLYRVQVLVIEAEAYLPTFDCRQAHITGSSTDVE